MKPYVSSAVKLTMKQKREIYGKLPRGGLTGEHFLALAQKQAEASSSTSS